MLHKTTVDPATLELLRSLQQKTYLKGFYLAGGTALALRLGHRQSLDIDLFADFDFDTLQLLENLSADFPFHFFSATNTLKGSIHGVQLDILAHRYPLIKMPLVIENITMLAVEDIIAMKLNAIAVSGQRVKDFIDIHFLLQSYSIAQMINYYKQKYTQYSETNVLKSLCWFGDVDISAWPVLIKTPTVKWDTVKKDLEKAVVAYLNQI
ncbi:hypothetical protein MASR1M74_26930 [Lentimicrobium sp.]